MKEYPDGREFEIMEARYQVRRLSRLKGESEEKVTPLEILLIFGIVIFCTVILPTVEGAMNGQ